MWLIVRLKTTSPTDTVNIPIIEQADQQTSEHHTDEGSIREILLCTSLPAESVPVHAVPEFQ